ncbi:hypothetical protein DXZ20_35560 [Leptolyngbyaceae cyanobacterium CCMR0081]|uniref:Uncharacterized protein n=1 Tax=Adonisia turfae CCMR0081 TaxID=2292702 RepID=A0A6M0RYR8_9CYAN|nr:hypothetical protein [Adonisia turfae CCMR0081]
MHFYQIALSEFVKDWHFAGILLMQTLFLMSHISVFFQLLKAFSISVNSLNQTLSRCFHYQGVQNA